MTPLPAAFARLLLWLVPGPAAALAAGATVLDASAFIAERETMRAETVASLTSRGVVQINGRRYLKMTSPEGSVFLPNEGAKLSLGERGALCQEHLPLMREVILLRDHVPVEPELRRDEAAILALIRKCREGLLRGPTLVLERPDGAIIEVEAPDKAAKR